MRLAAVVIGLALVGCAAESKLLPLVPDTEIKRHATEWYPDADAVVLKSSTVYRLDEGKEDTTRVTLRKVTAVRTNRGKDQVADLQLRVPAKTELVDVRAQVRQPDGTMRELAREEVMQLAAPAEVEKSQLLYALRFPDVRVGSILEYAIVYQYPSVSSFMSDTAHDEHPVVDYDVAVECDPKWACHLATFNAGSGPALEEAEAKFWRLRWKEQRLAQKPNEPFSPNWRSDTSWWANRLKWFNPHPDDYVGDVSWGFAVRWAAEGAFVEGRWSEGYAPSKYPVWKECKDDKCRFDKTVDWVRANIELSGEESFTYARPLVEILKSKRGTDGERAVLLARMLQDAGFETWLAGLVFSDQGALLKDFPASAQFEQALVYVEAKGNLNAQYVDALCDHCGENQVRPSAVGVEALQFRAFPTNGRPKVQTRFMTVNALAAPASGGELATTVVVTEKGEVRARLREKLTSMNAIPVALKWRTISPREADEVPLKRAREFGLSSKARNHVPPKCDLRAGTCLETWDLDWPHAADLDGDQLVASLPMFTEDYRHVWTAKRRYRDIGVVRPDERVEKALVTLPADFEVVELPQSSSRKSALFDSEITVSSEQDGIHITRKLTMRPGRRPKSEFAELQAVLKHYDSLAGDVLVLRRKREAVTPTAQK